MELPHVSPAGTQHGSQLCVEGAGVAQGEGGVLTRGHHYFNVVVVVPQPHAMPPAAQPVISELAVLAQRRRKWAEKAARQRPRYTEAFAIDSEGG